MHQCPLLLGPAASTVIIVIPLYYPMLLGSCNSVFAQIAPKKKRKKIALQAMTRPHLMAVVLQICQVYIAYASNE